MPLRPMYMQYGYMEPLRLAPLFKVQVGVEVWVLVIWPAQY